jgi:hypothetical protein
VKMNANLRSWPLSTLRDELNRDRVFENFGDLTNSSPIIHHGVSRHSHGSGSRGTRA